MVVNHGPRRHKECMSAGATRNEVGQEMHNVIEFHIEGLRLADEPVPQPRSQVSYCEVAA